MNAAQLFVAALENEGVRHIFGVPGEENLVFLDAVRESNLQFITTRHEQTAGFIAATVGRLTGKAGVCLSTLGPGAANLATAAAYATLGGMPMLMITGQKAIKEDPQGQFQLVDVVGMMRPLTKRSAQAHSGDNIPWMVREMFHQAEKERPGAVHIELPEDIAREETAASLVPKGEHMRPVADERSIEKAVEMIRAARSPLLTIGAGASRKHTSAAVGSFVQKTGIPFITTQMGKGVVDEDHYLFMGNASLSEKDFVHRAVSNADVIINVGHEDWERPPFIMKAAGKQKVIHVDFLTADIDQIYFPHLQVVGDIAKSMEMMAERLMPQPNWDLTAFMHIKEVEENCAVEGVDVNRFPLIPQRLVADLHRIMPESGCIAIDTGICKIWFARNYKAHRPNSILIDNALATMGAAMPSAMAVKILFPQRSAVAVCGDGGFMMNCQDLETVVRLKLDLTIVILNDQSYGMIRWKQAGMNLPDFGLTFGNPDFVKFADSFGAHGHRVESTGELIKILDRCIRSEGVHVIDVPMDYSDNDRLLHRTIPQEAARL